MYDRTDHLRFDDDTGTFHIEEGWTDPDSIVSRIPTLVGIVTDRDPTTLPVLYYCLDPEALADVLDSAAGIEVSVTFTYADCELTIDSDGTLRIRPPDLRGGERYAPSSG